MELEKLVHQNRGARPSVVEAKVLVASRGADLCCRQLQLLGCLSDCVEAGEEEGLCGSGRPHQLSLHRNDEVQVPKTHVRARDPADVVISHPRPGVDVERAKVPYLERQLSVF